MNNVDKNMIASTSRIFSEIFSLSFKYVHRDERILAQSCFEFSECLCFKMVDKPDQVEPVETEESGGLLTNLVLEIVQSPINIGLVLLITFLVYKILKSRQTVHTPPAPEPELPKIRRDFTVEELRKYDGRTPDGRVLVAVNGNVYDVTKGKRFYGPGGPYAAFGGRDASRGLATFSVGCVKDDYDDLSDLNSMEMDSVREWEAQFKEKYEFVGRLLKPGEEHRNYSDEEDETSAAATPAGDKPKEE